MNTCLRISQPGSLLFRSSRPDSIETRSGSTHSYGYALDCSGLLGRTPLRQMGRISNLITDMTLFRSSRPDSIETRSRITRILRNGRLFRSSRPDSIETVAPVNSVTDILSDCSGLLGRTPLRRIIGKFIVNRIFGLFRSSRPDSIETICLHPLSE